MKNETIKLYNIKYLSEKNVLKNKNNFYIIVSNIKHT